MCVYNPLCILIHLYIYDTTLIYNVNIGKDVYICIYIYIYMYIYIHKYIYIHTNCIIRYRIINGKCNLSMNKKFPEISQLMKTMSSIPNNYNLVYYNVIVDYRVKHILVLYQ
jgi:hypothetical protein